MQQFESVDIALSFLLLWILFSLLFIILCDLSVLSLLLSWLLDWLLLDLFELLNIPGSVETDAPPEIVGLESSVHKNVSASFGQIVRNLQASSFVNASFLKHIQEISSHWRRCVNE